MFRQSCRLILFSWVSLAPLHDAASANLATIRNRWNQREAHLSSISVRWNSNTHVPASVRAEAANFFLGDSGPK